MPCNRGTRRKPNWAGYASYKGKRKWVSGCKSVAEFEVAVEKARAQLCARVEKPDAKPVPTCLEFAGAVIHPNGRIRMSWPDGQRCQKDTGRTRKTIQRLREGLRPFLREFGERPIDSFSRDEALTWILPMGPHVQQSVRQFFNHAHDRELITDNKFARTGASKTKRRVDRPDFEIVSDEQYEQLLHCARTCRTDDFVLIIEGAILAVGEDAIRPSEIFALHKDEVDLDEGIIDVRWQIDSLTGKRVPPKDGDPRWVVPSPRFRAHLEIVMQSDRTILFPAVRGGYMTLPNWYSHWNAVRVAAGMPSLEFYELKHRALQWMIDPVENGGLGLDPATAALMAGHGDGGWLIANVYTKLAEHRAKERAKRAMRDYAERHPEDRKPPAVARSGQQATGKAAPSAKAATTTTTTYTCAQTEQAPTFWSQTNPSKAPNPWTRRPAPCA
jgi:integrase